jgi:hypothetical protein
MPAATEDEKVITANAAEDRFGVSYNQLAKAVMLGKVRTHIEPGSSIRYNRADVIKLAKELRTK